MQSTIQPHQKMKTKKMTALSIGHSIARSPLRRGLLLLALALCCFALGPAPKAFGVSPAPDGAYPGANTAEGQNALQSVTSGIHNTALGYQTLFSDTTGHDNMASGLQALFSNTTGIYNTGNGAQALYKNTTGNSNTATGFRALYGNTTGGNNTANGFEALAFNTTGVDNMANGFKALYSNTGGSVNSANGYEALYSNTTGNSNNAFGYQALFRNTTGTNNTANGNTVLFNNTTGSNNTANGEGALVSNSTGNGNTATGFEALTFNTTGNNNIALGFGAGTNLTTGDRNIDIGNAGVAGEASTIRIGDSNQSATFIAGIAGATVTGSAVFIDITTGQLGLTSSSERFKDGIESMGKASEALLSLRPVTFHYKKNIDPKGAPQFGLVAEDVEKVNPDLVVRDAKGKVFTVRYEAVNAMLLNEFLKEHRKVEEQETTMMQLKATVAKQEVTAAQQQKEIKALTTALKEQASQIQKVSAQLELNSPRASQVVLNNQ